MTTELERRLDAYVAGGALMQLATLRPDGSPSLSILRYHVTFAPDRLYFVSREDLPHSRDLRSDSRVAGSVVGGVPGSIPTGVAGGGARDVAGDVAGNAGEPVRPTGAVAFTGSARELPPGAQAPLRPSPGERVYRLDVTEWVLFDGPDQPGRVIPARP
ncbi:pyridoxamine 5'-phosphate oxidase family protein [Planotetraspora sp. A-T 1434]|uniref:pyridoxamine 5'-phosphate oxidase family protein n=1 Tax=Planotetraspora sp. A-T 1434 TaxID=2979219 RepID=UPI0021C09594|nr:pyridoxamine 5'-phosphate oxidase family protein [Planotetraspora sp. A-T 1434]MCT9932979.1 pyridoxamine 5'-phosphate oxidase family protein [Planotetraspora sp. A-T 1434]